MASQLFVGNLAFSTSKEELEAAFAVYGAVTEVRIPTDRDTGRVRGFAFVTMEDAEAAKNALALDGTELNGRPIRVNVAQDKKPGGGSGGGGRHGGGGGRGGSRGGNGGGRHGGGGRDSGGYW